MPVNLPITFWQTDVENNFFFSLRLLDYDTTEIERCQLMLFRGCFLLKLFRYRLGINISWYWIIRSFWLNTTKKINRPMFEISKILISCGCLAVRVLNLPVFSFYSIFYEFDCDNCWDNGNFRCVQTLHCTIN